MHLRKPGWYGAAVVSVLLGLVGMVGIYCYRRYQVRHEVVEVLAALDRSEPGWRLEALEQSRPALPPDDDSAVAILKLHSRLPPKWLLEDPETHWRDLWPNDPLPPHEAALFEPRMAQIKPLLPEVRRLADRPRVLCDHLYAGHDLDAGPAPAKSPRACRRASAGCVLAGPP